MLPNIHDMTLVAKLLAIGSVANFMLASDRTTTALRASPCQLPHRDHSWAVFGDKTVGVSSEAVNLVVGGLAGFGIFAALCALLTKPYALRLVFLNFLQWADLLVLIYPVIFLSPTPVQRWPGDRSRCSSLLYALGVPR
jgi:hypothetical protein